MIITKDINLTTANVDSLLYVNIAGFDAVSIESVVLEGGTTFNTGVISVGKSNREGGAAIAFGTPKTITAPGLTVFDSTLTDWGQTNFLVIECTTAASTGTRVMLTIYLTKLGFKLA